MKGIQRGALIVLEGCDRVGKTTQCKLLGKFEEMCVCYCWREYRRFSN